MATHLPLDLHHFRGLYRNERGELTGNQHGESGAGPGRTIHPTGDEWSIGAGRFRDCLLAGSHIQERICWTLRAARHIYLINSVRKWRTAVLVER